jgi:hypothetical protein
MKAEARLQYSAEWMVQGTSQARATKSVIPNIHRRLSCSAIDRSVPSPAKKRKKSREIAIRRTALLDETPGQGRLVEASKNSTRAIAANGA